MLTRRNLRASVERYLAGVLIYSLALVLYTQHSYYQNLLRIETVSLLKILYLTYLVGGLPYLFFDDKSATHKPSELIKAVRDLAKSFVSFSYSFLPTNKTKAFQISGEYKKILLFTLVKVFYIPLMLNFFFGNYQSLASQIMRWREFGFSFEFRDDYVFLLTCIFTIDTLIFCFGYLVEHKALKNVVRSAEPTLIGWAVVLASYPPFNSVTGQALNWYSNDYFMFSNAVIDISMKVVVVLLLSLYLWASFSLGTKASNLTNRGIVRNGAYRYVRHPAYIGKVGAWWIMSLPAVSIASILSLLGWTTVYYLRAVTEERHLITDPDYQKYVKKTKYRFIPNLI